MEKCLYYNEEQRWWYAKAEFEGEGDIILLEECTNKIEAWRKFFAKKIAPGLLFNREEKNVIISAKDRKVIHQK